MPRYKQTPFTPRSMTTAAGEERPHPAWEDILDKHQAASTDLPARVCACTSACVCVCVCVLMVFPLLRALRFVECRRSREGEGCGEGSSWGRVGRGEVVER